MKHRNLSNFSISKNIIRSVPKKKKKLSIKQNISRARNIDLETEQKSIICNNFENSPTTALFAHNLPVISLSLPLPHPSIPVLHEY